MSETKIAKAGVVRWAQLTGLALAGALVCLVVQSRREHQPIPVSSPAKTASVATAASPPPATTNPPAARQAEPQAVANSPWFQTRPFKVALTNGAYEWTAEDGMNPEVIRRMAHNERESQRMLRENDTIYRRQLVYDTQGFQLRAQQAVQSGQSLQHVTLPGLDGQEFEVVVTRTDLKNGGEQGQIYGQLPGEPNSMVTVAFIADREAFTVISPQDQIYLQAEAREPGEVVVKSINPSTYGMVK